MQDLRNRFVGCDADQIQDIWQQAYRARFYRGGPVLMVGSSKHKVKANPDTVSCASPRFLGWTSLCGTSKGRGWVFLSGNCWKEKSVIASKFMGGLEEIIPATWK